jgi:hypothetical protein
MSLSRKICVGEFIVGGVLSGVFLLTAKSTTPGGNRKRMAGLFLAVLALQLILDLLQFQ